VKGNPSLSDDQIDVAFSHTGLGRARRQTGDRAAAVSNLRRAIVLREGLATLSPEARYDLARSHALLAGLATEAGSGLSPAEGTAEADRAMAVLMRAVGEGFRDPRMSTDRDLNPLRARPDFQALMMDLTFPSDPFSKKTNSETDR
jgi:hypothetical protein